jgi:hypothetical protein
MERRRSPRFKARFDALYTAGREEGGGTLVQLSYSGARLAQTSVQPEIGTKVTLYIFIQPVAPFELTGFVARHTEDGFALDYDLFDAEVRRLVDDVAALIAEPAA